jgi:hypothetical protein
MLAQHAGDFIRRGAGVENNAMPGLISAAAACAILRFTAVFSELLSSTEGSAPGILPSQISAPP